MSGYYGGWAPYVSVAERRRKAMRAMEKLRKKGHPVAPVVIQGRAIATTFWGKAWCDNLESYRDYENRLPRGRTYVRNGSVVDLQIAPNEVTAMVSGSSVYKVTINVGRVGRKQWSSICKDCAGSIDSLVELLQGRLSKGVMERICRQDAGLFPKPAEIRFSCSCPDYASMCKHVAAVLYGVGARLDARPELLFRLRAADENELVTHIDAALPATKEAHTTGRILESDDLSALFGLDLEATATTAETADDHLPDERKQRRTGKSPMVKQSASTDQIVTPSRLASGKANKRNGARKTSSQQKRMSSKVPASARATAPSQRITITGKSSQLPSEGTLIRRADRRHRDRRSG
jgi:uncharacterized Zn finger protein